MWPSSIAEESSLTAGPSQIPQAPPEGGIQMCPNAEIRHPNQTCSNEELTRLQNEKDKLVNGIPKRHPMDTGNPKKALRIPCSYIRKRLEHMQKIKEKRQEIQNKCFGGKPDDVHKKAIEDFDNSIHWYKTLRQVNCAKGHPMETQ